MFGGQFSLERLEIILPVGISFYTFQTLSYSIDIYRRKIEATKDWLAFFAFVSFFPQLVAGPIERASNLLPQFFGNRKFDYDKAVDGMRQILWGLFKKVVIADNCAVYVNQIFNDHEAHSGSTLLLAAVLFAFQIYGDFSGYSDIAIGTARLFGFQLMRNFAFPYFSRDIAEFWRRWHISLSTWFRDYLYIPLGGSKGGTFKKIRNTFIIFLVSGFWHGANWTFLAWGLINAIFFLPLLLTKTNRTNLDSVAQNQILPSLKDVFQIGITFMLTTLAWVFFRSDSIHMAFDIIGTIFSSTLFSVPEDLPLLSVSLVAFFVMLEWVQRSRPHGLYISEASLLSKNRSIRWFAYFLVVFGISIFKGAQQDFIYFQF